MTKRQKIVAWEKLESEMKKLYIKEKIGGFCFLIRYASSSFKKREEEFILNEITEDMFPFQKFLFKPHEYEPRMKYIQDKINNLKS